MKTNETSTREKALAWWETLYPKQRKDLLEKHKLDDSYNIDYRIEEIWLKDLQEQSSKFEYEVLDDGSNYSAYRTQVKPNQKQFKQFDESLFKAYVDKFSDEDKLNALKVLFWSLSSEQQNHVSEIGIDKI